MSNLSPISQAVMEAWWNQSGSNQQGIATVLRAVADQAAPEKQVEDIDYVHQHYIDGWKDALDVMLAIANELEEIK